MNECFEFLNPRNPCSLLLFMVSKKHSFPSITSANHHFPISSNLVGVRPFSLTISSQTGPLSFINSCIVRFCPSSYSPCSTPNCSANTFQKCFHLNTSPLLTLKASFFAHLVAMVASASIHFFSLTPQTLSLHHSSTSGAASAFFTPFSLKPLPKLVISLCSVDSYANSASRCIRKFAVSSDLEEEVEDTEEEGSLDFSGPDEPSFSPDLKIFVGNLPFSVDSAALAELFGKAGTVEMVEVIYDKVSGRSRGFGFVTMSTVEEAEAAAQQFNGYELQGRALRVNSGPPPSKKENSSFRGIRGRERTSFDNTNKLYVGNLAWGVDNLALESLFGEQGRVKEARVVYDRESGRSRGFGFVTYSSPEEVNNAIEVLDGIDLNGRAIRVSPAEARPMHQY